MIYKLKPILKHRLWGGSKLAKVYGQTINDKIGEAWILSCLDKDISLTDEGKTLSQLFQENPEIVAQDYKGKFPLLIKLIDAHDDLSIQVHPEIKTEFWHILNPNPSYLYLGFNKKTNKDEVQSALKADKITDLLNHIQVKKDDSFMINPGTVHAIGKSTFLLEIQQSADVTYRLFDFNRKDSNGKTRELHVDQALKCLNYDRFSSNTTIASYALASCPFFNVYKFEINGPQDFNCESFSFHSLIVLNGRGTITTRSKEVTFKQYDSFFIPAGSGKYQLDGKATIVLVTL